MPEDLTTASETLVKSSPAQTGAAWTFERGKKRTNVLDDDGLPVARVWGGTWQEVDDRGSLIAAAPDLLKALKRVLTDCEFYDGVSVTRTNFPEAYAALAKAEER